MERKLDFYSSDELCCVLWSLDFNDSLQFAIEYMKYIEKGSISDYPKMNEIYEKCKVAYKESVEILNMTDCADYPYDKPTDEDLMYLEYHVVHLAWSNSKDNIRNFVRFCFENDTTLLNEVKQHGIGTISVKDIL